MNEPADDDFDFDAHIAKLIARSEQTLGLGPVPGFKSRVKFAGEDGEEELRSSDEEEEDSDDEFPDFLLDDMDPEAMAAYQKSQAGKKRFVSTLLIFGSVLGLIVHLLSLSLCFAATARLVVVAAARSRTARRKAERTSWPVGPKTRPWAPSPPRRARPSSCNSSAPYSTTTAMRSGSCPR